jgi:5-methylthioadenosine/S-adenosylhomocysteine deaminase
VKRLFKAHFVYPVSQGVITDGAILEENGQILRVDRADHFSDEELSGVEIIEFSEGCILPGLINSHTHLEYTSLGRLQAKSMVDFLWQMLEKSSTWNESKIRESIKSGIKQSLDCGVTTIVDISRWGLSPFVLSEYPLLADVALEAFSYDDKSSEQVFQRLKEKYQYIKERISDRVRLSISPHSPYNSAPVLWDRIISFTRDNETLIHSHIAESIEEKKWFEFGTSDIDELHSLIGWPKISPEVTSLSPVEYLSMLQLLPSNLIAAHLCYASTRDLELLEDKNVNIVICPRSNMNLHNKMLEYDLLKSLKIKALIGTDSMSSSGNLNILEDLRFYNSKSQISYEELTKMVTLYPAKALKLDDKVGSLEAGKMANFIVFEPIDDPANWFNHNKPCHVYIEGNNVLSKTAT